MSTKVDLFLAKIIMILDQADFEEWAETNLQTLRYLYHYYPEMTYNDFLISQYRGYSRVYWNWVMKHLSELEYIYHQLLPSELNYSFSSFLALAFRASSPD